MAEKNTNKGTLNKFEFTRLLSSRAFELSKGDKPKVDITKIKGINPKKILSKDYVQIAKQEFYEDKIELEIKK